MTDLESLNARLRLLQAQFNAETNINKRNDISAKIKVLNYRIEIERIKLKIKQLEG